MEEQKIEFSSSGPWPDLEADEVDLGRHEEDEPTDATRPIAWEQWGGIVERGRRESLILFRLDPKLAKKRAPGPGPIRKRDWAPLAKKWIGNAKVHSMIDTRPWVWMISPIRQRGGGCM